VRLTNLVCGNELVTLLAEKFNLGADIEPNDYAVFDHNTAAGEQIMLEEGDSPISHSLGWADTCEGSFWLRKLPQGLVRVSRQVTGVTNSQ